LSPAVEELRAGVHLNGEHVADGEVVPRHQPFADLPGACAHFVAAISQLGEHLAADHARVRGPEPAAGRIDDARIFTLVEPPLPPACAVSPGRWQRRIETDAARNGAVHGPADVTAAIDDDEILAGRAEAVRPVERG